MGTKAASRMDGISCDIFSGYNIFKCPVHLRPATFARRTVVFCPAELTCLSIVLRSIAREHAGYRINTAWNESVKQAQKEKKTEVCETNVGVPQSR